MVCFPCWNSLNILLLVILQKTFCECLEAISNDLTTVFTKKTAKLLMLNNGANKTHSKIKRIRHKDVCMLDKKFNKYRTLKKFMFIQKQKLAPPKEQLENMENRKLSWELFAQASAKWIKYGDKISLPTLQCHLTFHFRFMPCFCLHSRA